MSRIKIEQEDRQVPRAEAEAEKPEAERPAKDAREAKVRKDGGDARSCGCTRSSSVPRC